MSLLIILICVIVILILLIAHVVKSRARIIADNTRMKKQLQEFVDAQLAINKQILKEEKEREKNDEVIFSRSYFGH